MYVSTLHMVGRCVGMCVEEPADLCFLSITDCKTLLHSFLGIIISQPCIHNYFVRRF